MATAACCANGVRLWMEGLAGNLLWWRLTRGLPDLSNHEREQSIVEPKDGAEGECGEETEEDPPVSPPLTRAVVEEDTIVSPLNSCVSEDEEESKSLETTMMLLAGCLM
ncbi:hypothetical protein ZIOFF_005416 [Zingiber officinale]|uniref:Uncharacterized protein n=1 Tax=Zingiber officinale TaxID=94328 RepID=A0A8J5IAM4_ZINOF|nr:hypothetical protein ZIOFF_005416 [Zingiber officinale]